MEVRKLNRFGNESGVLDMLGLRFLSDVQVAIWSRQEACEPGTLGEAEAGA